MTEKPLAVWIIAGEPSGDRLAAALVRGLRKETARPIRLAGVGGVALEAEGMPSRFPIEEIAVMGIAEVAPKLRAILRRIRETADAVVADTPDLVITVDAPDFGLRVAKAARPALGGGTTFIHYVAPSVWAWRPGRAKKLAQRVDHLLALLPFEPPYFDRVGLSCDFVGHPLVESVASADERAALGAAFRRDFDIAPDTPLLAVLPGSRGGEVRRLTPVFKAAVALLLERRPDLRDCGLRLVAPMAEHRAGDILSDANDPATPPWPAPMTFLDPRDTPFADAEARKRAAFLAADAALAASGTVSLELAAARTPMVIGYKLNALSALIGRLLIKVDTATLVNLVSETRAVPEFLQEDCTPDALATALSPLLPGAGGPDGARAAQLAAAEVTMRRLGEGDAPPSQKAAQSVLRALRTRAAPA